MVRKSLIALLPAIVVAALAPTTASAARPATATAPQVAAITPCTGGMAGGYPCKNVDLQANLPLSSMGGGSGSGGWGWGDTTTGKEYAVVART
ncbi:MAG TPA: regulator, partial [Micromonosporaceae bacterium]|nr:regulator [Micromonosporaceae bacterium]